MAKAMRSSTQRISRLVRPPSRKEQTVSRRFLFILLSCLALAASSLARADDAVSSGGGGAPAGDKPTLTKNTVPSAIRVAVANGVIDFVNGTRRATLNLEWELLPKDATLLASERKRNLQVSRFFIPNKDLRDHSWYRNLRPAYQQLLREAFQTSASPDLPGATEDFREFWAVPHHAGYELAVGEIAAITASDYFCLQRDFLLLSGLLQTKGIRFSVDINGAKARGGNTKLSAEDGSDITWEITAYQFWGSSKISFYRFAVKAVMQPLPLLFPDTTETEAKLNVGVSILDSPETVGLLQHHFTTGPNAITVGLSEATKDKLQTIADAHALSDLETDLKLIGGGVQLGDIITKGLLGGTTDASIITGGLVGNGKVSQVIGVHQELSRVANASLGVLLGVQPGEDNSLFVGPSIQFSVITLAAGLRAFEKDKAVANDERARTGYAGAGVVSVDLSRLTKSKKTVTRIELANATTGGNIGVASDLIARDLALVGWTLKSPDPGLSFTLTQMTDRQGNGITDPAKRAIYSVTPTAGDTRQVLFLPIGRYAFGAIPEHYKLTDSGAVVDTTKLLLFSGQTAIKSNWELVPSR